MAAIATPLALGQRGVHVLVQGNGIDIRKYNRGIENPDELVATDAGVKLTTVEWVALMSNAEKVDAELKTPEPELSLALGQAGMRVVVNQYQGYTLVQVRKYFRPFNNPQKVLPTKQGIALKANEWRELCEKSDQLSQIMNN